MKWENSFRNPRRACLEPQADSTSILTGADSRDLHAVLALSAVGAFKPDRGWATTNRDSFSAQHRLPRRWARRLPRLPSSRACRSCSMLNWPTACAPRRFGFLHRRGRVEKLLAQTPFRADCLIAILLQYGPSALPSRLRCLRPRPGGQSCRQALSLPAGKRGSGFHAAASAGQLQRHSRKFSSKGRGR